MERAPQLDFGGLSCRLSIGVSVVVKDLKPEQKMSDMNLLFLQVYAERKNDDPLG